MDMKTLFLLTGVYSVLIVVSCKLTADSSPPYVITKPVSYCAERAGYYLYAGVEFTFLNTASKTVSDVAVSFMVFDRETQRTPFIGSNIIKTSFSGAIAGGQAKDFIISLDPYVYVAPEEPYLIDFFYISRIKYDDGSAWEDRNGIYHTEGMVN
jgi:hypothetical protein